jgi:uncharacterized membrane protein YedE/YeeE
MTSVHLRYAFYGLLFGFGLSRMGFGDFAQVHAMFVFGDLRLFLGFCGGVALSMMGFLALTKIRTIPRKNLTPGTVIGGVLFGVGWALTGACPSIALIQIGRGYMPAVATLVGVVVGVWIYPRFHRRWIPWKLESCAV